MRIILVLFCFFVLCVNSYAGDPFEWTPAPQGAYFTVYPVVYDASKLTDRDGRTVTNDLDLSSYLGVFRLTYYNTTTFSNTWALTAFLPVGRVKLQEHSDSGIGDLTIGAGYWVLDDKTSRTSLLVGTFIDLPTGNFDEDNVVNLGANVFKLRPIVALTKSFDRFHAEVALKYNIYGKEPKTGIKAGDEIIGEGFAGYFFRPNLIAGGVFNALAGRNRTIHGEADPGTGIRKYQAGTSICWIGSGFSVTIGALKEFGTRNTSEGFLLTGRLSWNL